ncbi:MAG: hypothetical protein FWH48_05955 [Oscillospiraceae bacterium]|nr:hypothetical protein [Oscillospiraceae bacterium]
MGRLTDIIGEYEKKGPVRFHMPGHKGKTSELAAEPSHSRDITELFFTDNLYEPDSKVNLIYGLEERIAKCFFKDQKTESLISCAGATLCVQAAILALKNLKKTRRDIIYVICDAASHISAINAMQLLDMTPLWIYPGENFLERIKYYANSQNISGVYVTSPDYFGQMKDIEKISKECKKHSLELVVDNSHGAHLAFHAGGCLHPIGLGASLSIDSLHKTLPVLTGAALLHSNGNFDKEIDLRPAMKMFASTSPSYLILQSIEQMVDLLEERGSKEHSRLLGEICDFKQKASGLGFEFGSDELRDPYRIVLECENLGEKLYYFLADQDIVCEFFNNDCTVALTSISNCAADFEKLFLALAEFSKTNKIAPAKSKKYICPPGVPKIIGQN